jgi:branched-chain amino acid transport system ATP-binding protein
VLEAEDVTVRFGGVTALSGVALRAPDGQVTGLIGPNGAGKTTFFDVATGLRRPRPGQVRLDGRDVTRHGPGRRARHGLGRTFQRLEVFGSLSVRDNVLLAAEVTGLAAVADRPAAELPTGTARLLEVARALATAPSTLLLDEPGSGLDEAETRALGDLLVDVAREGTAVLLVEHDVELVMRVCASVTVLDGGRVLTTGTPAEVQGDARVREAYLGAGHAPAPRAADHDALQEVAR